MTTNNSINIREQAKARMEEITLILNKGVFASHHECIALMNEWVRLDRIYNAPKSENLALWKALWEDDAWRAKKTAQLRQPRKKR